MQCSGRKADIPRMNSAQEHKMTKLISQNKFRRAIVAATFGAFAMSVTACANYGNTRTPGSVGYASTVKEGTITAVNPVTIKPDKSFIGAGIGAVLGGLAGSELGGGDKAKTAGGVVGAVGGAIAGNEAGKALNTRNGWSYIIKFDDGVSKEIVLKGNDAIPAGSRVNVIFATDGVTIQPTQYAPPAY